MAVGGNSSGGGSAGGIKAGSAYVELYVKNLLGKGLGDAQRQWQNFGNALGSIGRTMALGGAAALTPLVGAMSTLNDVAKQGSIAKALGLTSEQFTGIAGVAKSVGNDTKEFIESLVTLGKLGTDAAAGTEQASAAFASMGLNANEFIKLRADEQFFTLFDALNKMQDPLQRTRALMMAFGEDGGKILLPLLGKSGDELKKMAAGFAINADDMKAATSASASYAAATSALGKAWQSVSIAAAPIVKAIADGFAQAAGPLSGFISANREIVVGLGLAAGGITAVGVGLMVLGPAITALTASWGLFTGAVAIGKGIIAGAMAVIAAPVLLIPAGLAAAGAYLLATSDKVKSAFMGVFGRIKDSWSAIVGAFSRGDLELAFQIASATVEAEWLRLTTYLSGQWNAFKDAFTLDNIKQVFRDALAFIRDQFLATFDAIRDGDYSGAFGFGGGQSRELRNGGRDPGTAVTLGDWGDDTAKQDAADARVTYLKNVNKFRSVFAGMKGDAAINAAGGGLAAQIASIASQSRGGFGGTVSSGMFGGGDVGQKLVNNTKETADGIKKLIGIGSSRHAEKMGELTVEGGT